MACSHNSISGFGAPFRQRIEIVGSDATLVLDAPFLTEPDGPPPSIILSRDGVTTPIEVGSVDQVRAEVEDLTAVILDAARPRVDLPFSRGGIAALVELDQAARNGAGHVSP